MRVNNLNMANRRDFNFISFLWRWLFAALLVFLTYNPSNYSWLSWAINHHDSALVYIVATGLVLIIGWVMYVRATLNSLGPLGTILAAAFFAVIIWLLIEWGLLSLDNRSTLTWVIEFVLSGVLATGMSWSHVRRRISGQYDTDEIEG